MVTYSIDKQWLLNHFNWKKYFALEEIQYGINIWMKILHEVQRLVMSIWSPNLKEGVKKVYRAEMSQLYAEIKSKSWCNHIHSQYSL